MFWCLNSLPTSDFCGARSGSNLYHTLKELEKNDFEKQSADRYNQVDNYGIYLYAICILAYSQVPCMILINTIDSQAD